MNRPGCRARDHRVVHRSRARDATTTMDAHAREVVVGVFLSPFPRVRIDASRRDVPSMTHAFIRWRSFIHSIHSFECVNAKTRGVDSTTSRRARRRVRPIDARTRREKKNTTRETRAFASMHGWTHTPRARVANGTRMHESNHRETT